MTFLYSTIQTTSQYKGSEDMDSHRWFKGENILGNEDKRKWNQWSSYLQKDSEAFVMHFNVVTTRKWHTAHCVKELIYN